MKALEHIETAAVKAAAVVLGVMTLFIAADIVSRLVFRGSIPGIVELAVIGLLFVVYLPFADAERTSSHVATKVFISRLRSRPANVAFRSAMMPVVSVLALMTAATAGRAWQSYATGEFTLGLIRIPAWPGRAFISVGMALLTIEALRTVFRGLPGHRESAAPVGSREEPI